MENIKKQTKYCTRILYGDNGKKQKFLSFITQTNTLKNTSEKCKKNLQKIQKK